MTHGAPMTTVDSCRFSLDQPDLLRACASARQFDPHLHDTYSVVILTKGCVTLRSRRWSGSAREGDVFLFNPFEVHGGGSAEQAVEYDVLYPSARFVADCLRLRVRAPVYPLFDTGILRRCEVTENLCDNLRTGRSGIALEAALQAVLERCAIDSTTSARHGMPAVGLACRIIHDRYADPLGTDQLANEVGLHQSHFIRIFHHVTGLSPQNYLRQVRLARARELICTGQRLIDAAQAAGFCDQAHLTREFKKVHGVTPGQLSRDLRAPH